MVGTRIKTMWEEQLVDHPNEYINFPVNKPVNPEALYQYIIIVLQLLPCTQTLSLKGISYHK